MLSLKTFSIFGCFSVHALGCFLDNILYATDKHMFKVNNKKFRLWAIKKIRLICWICAKLKINTAWHSSCVFNVDCDHSQHANIVFVCLTLNKCLPVGCEKQVTMFWKHKTQSICFVIKVARPISFSDLSLHRIEINYEQMTILWTYYEHSMNIFFSSKFVLGMPSILSSFRFFRFFICFITLFSRDLIFFCCMKPKTYLNHWNSGTNWLVFNLLRW